MFYNKEERIGVYAIAKIFTEDFKWIFREQSINDFGIDGLIEITRVGRNLKDLIPTGKLIGVQKSQISRIESNASNVTIDTLMRVFNALQAKVKLQVELPHFKISLGQ